MRKILASLTMATAAVVVPNADIAGGAIANSAPYLFCYEGEVMSEDGTCVPAGYYGDDAGMPQEDEPGFDCRTMGNRICGVQISGEWYVIRFDANGEPRGVDAR